MRVTLKAINGELAKREYQAVLVNGDRYFSLGATKRRIG